MPDYLVRWEINLTADSPLQAAEAAKMIQSATGSTANVFEVGIDGDSLESIDLDEVGTKEKNI